MENTTFSMKNASPSCMPPLTDISSLDFSEYEFHGSNASIQRELWETIVKTTLYALVFVMAIVGNLLVILVVVCNHHMRTTTNFYLVNLAAADITTAIFCMWTHLIKHLSYPEFLLGAFMCRVDAFIHSK